MADAAGAAGAPGELNGCSDVGQVLGIVEKNTEHGIYGHLNTSLGVTVVYDVLKADTNDATKRYVLGELDKVLSLNLLDAKKEAKKESSPQDAEIEALIAQRTEARKNKDWATADAIRDKLAEMKVVVVDTKDGISWHYAE